MKSIRARFLAIFCTISLVSALTSAAIVFSLYASYITATVEERLINGLSLVSEQVDLADFSGQIAGGQQHSAELEAAYVADLTALLQVAKAYGYDSIYTLEKLSTGGYRFILDSYNIEEPSESDFLDPYDDAPPEMDVALNERRTVISEPYTDEWGTYISAFAPIVYQGKVIGVVGLDYEISMVQGLYQRAYRGSGLAIGVALLLTAVIGAWVARSISRPLEQTAEMIDKLGQGDLTPRLKLTRNDEVGRLARQLDAFADTLQHEILEAFNRLAKGDFTFVAHGLIAQPLAEANQALNVVMAQIRESGNQIASGSDQIAASSQQLSQSATEQASSLEQVTSSMAQITGQTAQNSDHAREADQLSRQTMDDAGQGRRHMTELMAAMGEINDAAQNIAKVIKVIDEIAFQTNLLALNAAVEAARAVSMARASPWWPRRCGPWRHAAPRRPRRPRA